MLGRAFHGNSKLTWIFHVHAEHNDAITHSTRKQRSRVGQLEPFDDTPFKQLPASIRVGERGPVGPRDRDQRGRIDVPVTSSPPLSGLCSQEFATRVRHQSAPDWGLHL